MRRPILAMLCVLSAGLSEAQAGAQDIFTCAQEGDVEGVAAILERDPTQVNRQNREGRTPLHLAAMAGSVDVVALLLSEGARTDVRAGLGETPFFFAVRSGNLRIGAMLLDHGADMGVTLNNMTMLHIAVLSRHPAMVGFLLDRGMKPDARDRHGITALHMAAAYGFPEIAEMLVERGANPNARSMDGGTPFHLARAAGRDEIATLLEEHGARDLLRKFPAYRGPYLGAKPPGKVPEPFVPTVIWNLNRPHSGFTTSPDGKEICWSDTPFTLQEQIWCMEEELGKWTPPRLASFSGRYSDSFPWFSPDGERLFFASQRPVTAGGPPREDPDIWYVEKQGEGWGEPVHLGPEVNTSAEEFTPTVDREGTLYFTRLSFGDGGRRADLYRSSLRIGRYEEAEKMSPRINRAEMNYDCMVAPDGSYLIYTAWGLGKMVSFWDRDSSWRRARPIDDLLPSNVQRHLGISADGKYIFLAAERHQNWEVFWVDAELVASAQR